MECRSRGRPPWREEARKKKWASEQASEQSEGRAHAPLFNRPEPRAALPPTTSLECPTRARPLRLVADQCL